MLVALASCRPADSPLVTVQSETVRVGFSDATRNLMETVIPIYGDEVPSVNLETEVGHIEAVMAGLKSAQLDAALVSGEPTVDANWWTSPVAVEGLVIIANPLNPVGGLTMEQVQLIFQGQIWSWESVGGGASEITVVVPDSSSAPWEIFQRLVMKERHVTLTAVVLPDTNAVCEYVAQDPHAIGYVAAAAVSDGNKALAIDGLYATSETLYSQRYPISFPITFVAPEEPSGVLRQFASWLLSRDGQAVIGRMYGRIR